MDSFIKRFEAYKLKNRIYKAKVCSIEKKMHGVEAVIVTPVYQYEEIKRQIRKYNDIEVISLRELLNGRNREIEGKKETVITRLSTGR